MGVAIRGGRLLTHLANRLILPLRMAVFSA
jgi:hypothetical protein